MEEEIKFGEQLEIENPTNAQEIIVEDKGATCEEDVSGSLGKFKDAESLLTAYNNLQAEFTRKCQKLSDVTLQLECQKELAKREKEVDATPIYMKDDWQKTVSTFLEQNSGAKKYSAEIANEILNDASLQSSANALELAWAKVMQTKYAEPEELANDQNFINEKILSRDEVKKQVLEEYFKNLNKQKTPPVIGSLGTAGSLPRKNPTNLAEAKLAVEKLFNLKG